VRTERGKFIPTGALDTKMKALREYAEEDLFDGDAVPFVEIKRKAGARVSWYWLPPGSLEYLKEKPVSQKHWKDQNGLIYKKLDRITSVMARIEQVGVQRTFSPCPPRKRTPSTCLRQENLTLNGRKRSAATGDVLIRGADTIHGGSEILDPAATRRSLVAHYCPIDVSPIF
jgi:hypothetical protein